jgi:hypothetical protein
LVKELLGVCLLYSAISDKTQHFDLALAHNFRTILKRCSRRNRNLPKDQMEEECRDFGTSIEACSCAETVHLSSCYRTDIPCSHRYSKGAHKPDIPRRQVLKVEPSLHGMQYSEVIHDRAPRCNWSGEEVEGLKLFACQQIKRFSHVNRGKAIDEYVNERMDVSGPTALGIPLSVHKLIMDGVVHFTSLTHHA